MNLFLFHFRVPNWELRNKKLHFELLTPWSNFYFFAYLRLKIKFPFESLTQWVDFHFLTFELWNTQVDKTFSVNKGSAKICLVVGMVKKNWSWIVVASCGLHYFVALLRLHYFESLRTVQPKDLNICSSHLWKFTSWLV